MKRDTSRIKFCGIGGGTTESAEHDIGAGSGDAPIGGGTSNDKLPKA
ncbi:MAG: hypothetical protein QMC36_02720 [Patescibacteria group bacterium]